MWLLTALDIKYRAVRFAVVTVGTALVFTLLFLMTGLIEQFNQEPFLMVDQVSSDDWAVPDGSSGPFTSSQVLRPDQVEALGGTPVLVARGTTEIDGEESEGIVLGLPDEITTTIPLANGRSADGELEAVVDVTTGLEIGDSFGLGNDSFDVVGLTQGFTPRHARRFGEVGEALSAAVKAYRDAVVSGDFPAEAESSSMEQSVLDEVLGRSALDQASSRTAIPLDRDL